MYVQQAKGRRWPTNEILDIGFCFIPDTLPSVCLLEGVDDLSGSRVCMMLVPGSGVVWGTIWGGSLFLRSLLRVLFL